MVLKTTEVNKPRLCVDEAGCENFKALFGTSGSSDRLESRGKCSKSPSEVHRNTYMTHQKKELRQTPTDLYCEKCSSNLGLTPSPFHLSKGPGK